MKIIISLFLMLLSTGEVLSQEISQSTVLKAMQNLAATEYWTKGPTSLMLYCRNLTPESSPSIEKGYLAWTAENSEVSDRVEKISRPVNLAMAKFFKKTDDKWQVHLTKMVDEQVIEKFTSAINEKTRRASCMKFHELLSNMFSNEVIKPRVLIAADELELMNFGPLGH